MLHNCKFKLLKENYHQCINCGKIVHKILLDKKHTCLGIRLLQQASDVLDAGKKYIERGSASEEEKNIRLNICKQCEHYDNGSCKLCGCNLKLKSRIASANCPIDKW